MVARSATVRWSWCASVRLGARTRSGRRPRAVGLLAVAQRLVDPGGQRVEDPSEAIGIPEADDQGVIGRIGLALAAVTFVVRWHGEDAPARPEMSQQVLAEPQAGHLAGGPLERIEQAAGFRFDRPGQLGEASVGRGGIEGVDHERARGSGDRRRVVPVERGLIEPS